MSRDVLVRAVWLVAPVLLAGLGHVAVLKADILRRLAVPLDAGMSWHGHPVLGANKTWRGPVVMMAGTAVATRLGTALWSRPAGLRPRNEWAAGTLIGLAYALAELPNSFVKRRLGVVPGGRSNRFRYVQYLVDQVDSVAGCLVAARLLYRPSRLDVAAALALGTAAHVAVDRLMHAIGLRRR